MKGTLERQLTRETHFLSWEIVIVFSDDVLEELSAFLEPSSAQLALVDRERLTMLCYMIVIGVARLEHRRADLTVKTMLIAVQMLF